MPRCFSIKRRGKTNCEFTPVFRDNVDGVDFKNGGLTMRAAGAEEQ